MHRYCPTNRIGQCCIIYSAIWRLAYLRLTSRFLALPQKESLATVGGWSSALARIGRTKTASNATKRPSPENQSTSRRVLSDCSWPIINHESLARASIHRDTLRLATVQPSMPMYAQLLFLSIFPPRGVYQIANESNIFTEKE